MRMPDLQGKVAVVTGGGGVLCSDFSRAIARAGAKVAVMDIRLAAAQKVADDICAQGGTAIAVEANCLDPESMKAARAMVTEKLGKCDILINGAGGNNPKGTTDDEVFCAAQKAQKSFFDLDPAGIRFVFDLNVLSAFITSQVFCEDMAKDGHGCVVNISSMNAYRPLTKIPAYSGAKAAVSNFTMWLAVYLAGSGVRVNAIAPGFFVTEQNRALLFTPDGKPTARTGKILNATPMKRFGEASELTGTLYFLLDDTQSGFVTGTVIPVDGGFAAYSGV